MIKIKKARPFLSLATFVLSSLPSPVMAGTEYQQGKSVKVMGAEMGAELSSGVNGASQALTTLSLQSLGSITQAFFALTSPPNTIGGTTYTEVYSFGKRVFADSSYFSSSGGEIKVGLAPTQIRVPFVTYPVGPVLLQVDGGVRFQADLTARNMTNISIPIQYSEPGIQLSAVLAGAGYIEGHASFFVIRAGVGGQLDLVDAKLDVNTKFNLEEKQTSVNVAAIVEFLKGRLYAFLDVGFEAIGGGLTRLWDYDLFRWNGVCFATENLRCPKQ